MCHAHVCRDNFHDVICESKLTARRKHTFCKDKRHKHYVFLSLNSSSRNCESVTKRQAYTWYYEKKALEHQSLGPTGLLCLDNNKTPIQFYYHVQGYKNAQVGYKGYNIAQWFSLWVWRHLTQTYRGLVYGITTLPSRMQVVEVSVCGNLPWSQLCIRRRKNVAL